MPSVFTVLAWGARSWKLLLPSAFLFLAVGELAMRLPFVPQRLEYVPDEELGAALKPDQRGFLWMANLSAQSPPITLNPDGHRSRPTDWSRPALVTLGDSEGFGLGVQDDEVYTAVLEARLRGEAGGVQVVNAAQPGFGPYHQLVVLRRLLARHAVAGVLARVSLQDRNFRAPSARERDEALAAARRNHRVRQVTRFLPHLWARAGAQAPAVGRAVQPWFLRGPGEEGDERSPESGRAMWRANEPFWREMAALTARRQVPLIFLVHDPLGDRSSGALWEAGQALAARHPHCRLVRVGPGELGLGGPTPAERWREYRSAWTLWESHRDLHANARQHRRVAEVVADHLRRSDVFRGAGAARAAAGGDGQPVPLAGAAARPAQRAGPRRSHGGLPGRAARVRAGG